MGPRDRDRGCRRCAGVAGAEPCQDGPRQLGARPPPVRVRRGGRALEVARIEQAIIKGDIEVLVEFGGLQAALKHSVALEKQARREAGRGLLKRAETWWSSRFAEARFR